jgi:hypothetical protein
MDPYSDFTDLDPDPTCLPAVVHKSNFFKHHITNKKVLIKANILYCDQREKTDTGNTSYYQFGNTIF